MRVLLLILIVVISPIDGLSRSRKRQTVVGTIIAHDVLDNVIGTFDAPKRIGLIVRTRPTSRRPSQLIEVLFTYWGSENRDGFPDELVAKAREWRFKLKSLPNCQPIHDSIPLTDNTGKEINRILVWELLPGADSEKLPIGKILPCYELRAHDYNPIVR